MLNDKIKVLSSKHGVISAATLHLAAMLFMLMDHLWATLLPAQDWLTCVGRLAFPVFAFMAVEGYFHTHSFKRYALRLLVLAVISEVPFDLMYGGTWFYPFHQNVIWTLLMGLLGIHIMEAVRETQKKMGICDCGGSCPYSRSSAWNRMHGRLLWCRCPDRICFLSVPGTELVVSAGTSCCIVLD